MRGARWLWAWRCYSRAHNDESNPATYTATLATASRTLAFCSAASNLAHASARVALPRLALSFSSVLHQARTAI